MKTKFKKGDQVILKTKLTSDPLTIVNVTTKKETKVYYHGFCSSNATKKEVEVTRYELSNHKIVEEDDVIAYCEGVQRLARKMEETFRDLGRAVSDFKSSSRCDDAEDED